MCKNKLPNIPQSSGVFSQEIIGIYNLFYAILILAPGLTDTLKDELGWNTRLKQLFKEGSSWVICLGRIHRDVTSKVQLITKQQEKPPPYPRMCVLTQVNKPWFSWICVVRLNQRSKRNSKNLLGFPGRRTSASYLCQLSQNKEIIVHCVNWSKISEQNQHEQMT